LRQARRDWEKETYTTAFENAGPKDPRWAAHARRAVVAAEAHFSGPYRAPDLLEVIWSASREAVAAGCDDPLILYFRVRWSDGFETLTPQERNRLFLAAAKAMAMSNYPAVRRAHALANCAASVMSDPDSVPDARAKARQLLDEATALLPEVLKSPNPEARSEALSICDPLLAHYRTLDGDREVGYRKIDDVLDQAGSPKVFRQLLRAQFYIYYAWDARGNGVAATVTPEGWRLFQQRLREAEAALQRSWALDGNCPLAPTRMITVALGLEHSREQMEVWFRRALRVDPDCYDACVSKLLYLEPKWHGSREEMLAFAREAVRTGNREAGLPLLLPHAHRTLASYAPSPRSYYSAGPTVWQDIRAGYEAYLAKHPSSRAVRSWYAKEAYFCGRYREARQQFERLGDRAWKRAFDNEAQYQHIRAACERFGKEDGRQ
jgi:hypothetical protein